MDIGSITNLCDCSNELAPYQPARCTSLCDPGVDASVKLQIIERRIQNQARVMESQYIDVLGAVTVASSYLKFTRTATEPWIPPKNGSSVWGNKFNLRNQSDQREPSRTGSVPKNAQGSTNYVNVPTRGNSLHSTITANKPGAMTPGGYGVDVKHGSYDRYLAKKKGRLLTITRTPIASEVNSSSVNNNKSFKFSVVNVGTKPFINVVFMNCPSCTNIPPPPYIHVGNEP